MRSDRLYTEGDARFAKDPRSQSISRQGQAPAEKSADKKPSGRRKTYGKAGSDVDTSNEFLMIRKQIR